MFDLNLRNAAHENLSDREGFLSYQTRWQFLCTQLLFGSESPTRTKEQIADHLGLFWQLIIIPCLPEYVFVTSDNPSILLSVSTSSKLVHGVILPLTPQYLVIGFDKRHIRFKNRTLSRNDVSGLNGQQIANSISALYSSRELPADDLLQVQHHFTTATPAARTEFTNEQWIVKLRDWADAPELDFISAIPPIL